VFIIHFKKISVVCCYLQSLFIHESEQSVHTHIYIYIKLSQSYCSYIITITFTIAATVIKLCVLIK